MKKSVWIRVALITLLIGTIIGCGPGKPDFDAGELEKAIKKFIPEAQITYKPDPVAMELMQSLPIKVLDDSRARQEWGWQPQYENYDKVVEDFIQEVKTRPEFYGLV